MRFPDRVIRLNPAKRAGKWFRTQVAQQPAAQVADELKRETEDLSIVALGALPTSIPSEVQRLRSRATPAEHDAGSPAEVRAPDSAVQESLRQALESADPPTTILLIVDRSSTEE